MRSPYDLYLDAIAARMGRYLRGFDDPRIHLGSPGRFASQFRKVMELPALHRAGEDRLVSCAEALSSLAMRRDEAAGGQSANPAALMTQVLEAAGGGMPGETLRKDVEELLRFPALSFYLQVSNRKAFFTALREVAANNAFRLATRSKDSRIVCSVCRNPVLPETGFPVRCLVCNRAIEAVSPLPMVPAVAAFVSYEMLRQMVAIDTVETYQEESEIKPVIAGEDLNDIDW